MTLREWDSEIAPTLRAIEQHSLGIQQRVKSITAAVHALALRPEWITRAEVELTEAKVLLNYALKVIQDAQSKYNQKPTNTGEAGRGTARRAEA